MPLLFILVVAAVKEFIEDLVRILFDTSFSVCFTLSKDLAFCEKVGLVLYFKNNTECVQISFVAEYIQYDLILLQKGLSYDVVFNVILTESRHLS